MRKGRRSSGRLAPSRVRVAVRIRPAIVCSSTTAEDAALPDADASSSRSSCSTEQQPTLSTLCLSPSNASGNNAVQFQCENQTKTFTFDHVFPSDSTQKDVYASALQPMLTTFLNGFNVTVLAYGQTGSGKTYTVGNKTSVTPATSPARPAELGAEGRPHQMGEHDGLLPRFLCDLFASLRKEPSVKTIHVSFLEIYCDEVRDLLQQSRGGSTKYSQLAIREDEHNVWVENLRQLQVENVEKALELVNLGRTRQAVSSNALNDTSSRSHAIYTMEVSRKFVNEIKKTKLTFVDLAGSERIKKTKVEGVRMKESIQINVGLLALGNVINALGDDQSQKRRNSADGAETPAPFVPYRSSKLTRLLRDSLGGNSMTLFIACVSPLEVHGSETLNTLQYANRARNIQNKAEKNVESLDTGSPRNSGSPRNVKRLQRTASEIEISSLQEQICFLKQQLDQANAAAAAAKVVGTNIPSIQIQIPPLHSKKGDDSRDAERAKAEEPDASSAPLPVIPVARVSRIKPPNRSKQIPLSPKSRVLPTLETATASETGKNRLERSDGTNGGFDRQEEEENSMVDHTAVPLVVVDTVTTIEARLAGSSPSPVEPRVCAQNGTMDIPDSPKSVVKDEAVGKNESAESPIRNGEASKVSLGSLSSSCLLGSGNDSSRDSTCSHDAAAVISFEVHEKQYSESTPTVAASEALSTSGAHDDHIEDEESTNVSLSGAGLSVREEETRFLAKDNLSASKAVRAAAVMIADSGGRLVQKELDYAVRTSCDAACPHEEEMTGFSKLVNTMRSQGSAIEEDNQNQCEPQTSFSKPTKQTASSRVEPDEEQDEIVALEDTFVVVGRLPEDDSEDVESLKRPQRKHENNASISPVPKTKYALLANTVETRNHEWMDRTLETAFPPTNQLDAQEPDTVYARRQDAHPAKEQEPQANEQHPPEAVSEPDFILRRPKTNQLSISPRGRRRDRSPQRGSFRPMKLFDFDDPWDQLQRSQPSSITKLESLIKWTQQLLADEFGEKSNQEEETSESPAKTSTATVEECLDRMSTLFEKKKRAKQRLRRLKRHLHQFELVLGFPGPVFDDHALRKYVLPHQEIVLQQRVDFCEAISAQRLYKRLQSWQEAAVFDASGNRSNVDSIFLSDAQYSACAEWLARLHDRAYFQKQMLPLLLNGWIAITPADLEKEDSWLAL